MEWILQNNIESEIQDFDIIKNIFNRFQIPYQEVSVQNGHVTPQPVIHNNPVMVLGNYSLMRYAEEHGLKPGCYTENMNMTTWIERYGHHMLNYDARIMSLGKINESRPFFIRPEKDSKEFSGKIFHLFSEFDKWRAELIRTSHICNTDTAVVLSPLQKINRESRFFIVDDKVISASVYKVNGTMRTSPIINEDEIDFVNQMIAIWTPNRAFVMDVATTDDGLKIVELNCINCSGFYEADIQKIVMELDYIGGQGV